MEATIDPLPTVPADRLARLDADTLAQLRGLGAVVTVWAHPDDESYLAGGLMAALVALGSPVACVTATAGERGGPPDAQAELSWRRPEELRDALGVLGVTDHVLLDQPDGRCSSVDPTGPIRRLVEVLEMRRPDTVVTFGADGLTGHPDHRAVSRWVSAALLLQRAPRPRLLHATETPENLARLPQRDGIYDPGLPRLHRREQLALQVRASGVLLDTKVAALRAHRTQTEGLEAQMGAPRYRAWVAEESFVSAPS